MTPTFSDDQVQWRKSSYSDGGDTDGQCVEVGSAPGVWYVRDTKDRAGGSIVVTPAAWAGFVAAVKRGDLA